MYIAIAQINCTVGDITGNAAKILAAVKQAEQAGATLIITPELALSGYPPADLLLRETFCQLCQHVLTELAKTIGNITLIVGHPSFDEDKLYNAASVIRNGEILHTYHKRILNKSPFFNESYYFDAGTQPYIFELEGIRFGIDICADFWLGHLPAEVDYTHLDIVLVLNASAYHINKQVSRYQATHQFIKHTGIAVIHTNLVGGQDELVFDGASFVMNGQGELTHQLEEFAETIGLIEIQNKQPVTGKLMPAQSPVASVYQALCLGVRDYVHKNGFPGVLLGLSGGVDSALALAIAFDALGADQIKTVMMPSQYTAGISLEDANEMAELLKIKHIECSIEPLFDLYLKKIAKDFQISLDPADFNTMPENIQARIRGTLLMALSNYTGAMVLTTGNKSELAVGYCTLYGDMAGGFAVLKDVSKTLVYQLCEYRNQIQRVIPERIIRRAPTAELRLNQTDQDNLPAYEILDGIIEAYVEKNLTPAEIIALHYDQADVTKVIQLIHMNEYKRRQSPPGIRITRCDFGTAWRYPIGSHYKAWATPLMSEH
ncbi:NAD+ synthase [Nitrosomonas supralitoralis]|uniref:Glutamine-dependent NAD(+) synthetase n=1 Tax=Nitrosomonas supralitoralis TaxID=2116706 RepID=A0A2P7NTD0_9PROT|nr:NAD+ synthase [Nitrosomonas supralitoralis]PSJ16720.1 NAD+ synthase [Nitrosomonas supralitoralis]